MVKFVVTTALVATVGSAYLGNLNNMAQQVLDSGKKVFGSHARTIESLSKDGENSLAFEIKQGKANQVAFANTASQNAYHVTVAVTPVSQYGRNACAVTLRNHPAMQTAPDPDGALYGSGPIEIDEAAEGSDSETVNENAME